MSTQVQIRGAAKATQEARTLASRELDANTTDKRIALHDGSTAGGIPHANYLDVINNTFNYEAASGTNALTLTLEFAPLAYTAGMQVIFKAANSNTSATTINVNSLGAKNIYKVTTGGITALTGGEIIQNGIYSAIYDGTQFLLNQGGGASDWQFVQSQTASGSASLDFDNVFITGYNYTIVFDSLVPASATSPNLYLLFSNDGGSTYLTSYNWSYTAVDANKNQSIDNQAPTYIPVLFSCPDQVNSIAAGVSGQINLRNPALSSSHRINGEMFAQSPKADSGSAASMIRQTTFFNVEYGAFRYADSFRLYFTTGNIASGTVSVYRTKVS